MTHTRQSVIRAIASSLAFDADPPYLRSLDKARAAGAHITDALVQADILGPEYADNSEDDYAGEVTSNGHAGDVDTAPLPFQ